MYNNLLTLLKLLNKLDILPTTLLYLITRRFTTSLLLLN